MPRLTMTTTQPLATPTFAPIHPLRHAAPASGRSGLWRGAIALVTLAVATGAAGCLNETYRIPDQELARLTTTPPEARGLAIRSVQRTMASTELTSTPYLPPGAPPPPNGPPPEGYAPGYYYGPTSHVHFGVAVWAPLPAPHYVSRPPVMQEAPVVRGAPGAGGPAPAPGGGGFNPSHTKVDKSGVAAMAILGAAFTVGMIATEGARFDGWTRVHPAQPIHLVYPGGQQRAVPLYLLSPADLTGVEEAAISENDGRVDRLQRAPLNRKGLVWRFDAGLAGGGTIDRQPALGWGALMGLGYFPHQTFGLLINGTVAAGDHGGTSYTNGRLALEANWLPLSLGPLHLGVFGMAGRQWAQSSSDTFDKVSHESWVAGGGGLLELELSTRLALVLRAGLLKDLPDVGPSAPTPMLATVGFSVY